MCEILRTFVQVTIIYNVVFWRHSVCQVIRLHSPTSHVSRFPLYTVYWFQVLRIDSVLWRQLPMEKFDRVQVRRKCTWQATYNDKLKLFYQHQSLWSLELCLALRYLLAGGSVSHTHILNQSINQSSLYCKNTADRTQLTERMYCKIKIKKREKLRL